MNTLALLADPHAWAALVTLSVLEIVLGIDNLVFISVLTARLDGTRRAAPARSASRSPSSSAWSCS
jgi:predicted tellurium resistance membrane protein TerC